MRLDLAASPAPVLHFDECHVVFVVAVGWELKLDQGSASGSVLLLGDHAGHIQVMVPAGERSPFYAGRRADGPDIAFLRRRQHEARPACAAGRQVVLAQVFAGRLGAVALGVQQIFGRVPTFVRLQQELQQVRLTVADVEQERVTELSDLFCDTCSAVDPACAFFLAPSHAVGGLRLTRPHPSIQSPKRLARRADLQLRIQVTPAPRLAAQRGQALDLLSVEVQFRVVEQYQDNRLGGHAPCRSRAVRLYRRQPVERLLKKQSVCRPRFSPTATPTNKSRHWLVGRALRWPDFMGLTTFVSLVQTSKLDGRPPLAIPCTLSRSYRLVSERLQAVCNQIWLPALEGRDRQCGLDRSVPHKAGVA